MTPSQNYRDILKTRLEERCRANPRYSLRAFARDLKISPSRLSEILRGKQGLSKQYSEQIAHRLGLNENETQVFTSMVTLTDARSKKERALAKTLLTQLEESEQKVNAIREDTFRVIEDWYHYAIIELVQMPSFVNSAVWISRRLGITIYEADAAIARLKRVGLLAEEKGKLVATERGYVTTDEIPSESIRKFNLQILEKASTAITTQSIHEREIGTLTIGIDERDLPEYKQMIKTFRRRVNQLAMARAQSTGSKVKQVYCLAVQFFRLTNKDEL